MASPSTSRAVAVAVGAGISIALLWPAQAQFWDWGHRPQRQYHQPQFHNPFGGWFEPRGGSRDRDQYREAPVDHSRAPAPAQKKPEATISVVVVGDANADWLAHGLEEALSEKPEIGIVRKHRTESGLIRYDGRRDTEWAQVTREIIAAEKPKFIVMMIGNNDRQSIRERAPAAVRPGAPKAGTQAVPPQQGQQPHPGAPAPTAAEIDPEQQTPAKPEVAEQPANLTPEQARQASYGPWEFRTEKWELAYIKRVDATIAALKSAGVPVLWVGLPSQRGPKASGDSAYLNEIYRSRAEKAGITYVDIWDGFVDEAGRFSPQGPDYEGQIRRLRSGDGVYYTKFGARKLAHYVEREIQRHITNRSLPVALPVPEETGPQAPGAKPGGPAQRPVVGPVVPLTAARVQSEELLGGGRAPARTPATDPTASKVLVKGEPIAAPSGRADDFSWPRGSMGSEPSPASPGQPATAPGSQPGASPAAPPAAARATRPSATAGQRAPWGSPWQPQQRRDAPRPPLGIFNFFR
jgi:hypothetical protein